MLDSLTHMPCSDGFASPAGTVPKCGTFISSSTRYPSSCGEDWCYLSTTWNDITVYVADSNCGSYESIHGYPGNPACQGLSGHLLAWATLAHLFFFLAHPAQPRSPDSLWNGSLHANSKMHGRTHQRRRVPHWVLPKHKLWDEGGATICGRTLLCFTLQHEFCGRVSEQVGANI